jgi:protoheme IX farnesyltransferase
VVHASPFAGDRCSGLRGVATCNHYFDPDIDGTMMPTKRCPLFAGQVSHPGLVFVVGFVTVAVFNLMLVWTLWGGAFTYVEVYTLWLKRRISVRMVHSGVSESVGVTGG